MLSWMIRSPPASLSSLLSLDSRMRQRSFLARGLALTLALVMTSPFALAATPRSKKPAAKSKKVQLDETPAPKAEEPAPKAEEPAPKAEEQPTAETPPASAAEAQATPAADTSAGTPAKPAESAGPTASDEASPAHDNEAELGRREARRIAAGRIVVAVWAGGGVANRRFSYSDAVGYNLAPYNLPAAPMATFGIEAYPAASSDVPVLRDLGIRAHVSRGFAFDSNTPQHVTLETNWTRFGGELRQR